jgi:Uma2 family endonuclease
MTTRLPRPFRDKSGLDDLNDPELYDRAAFRVIPDPDAPDDLEPLPDAMQQEIHVNETIQVVRTFFLSRQRVVVSGDTPVYYIEADGRQQIVRPDCYVAFRVNPLAIRRRNGYFIREVGKAPDFVLEIASETTYSNDLGPKRELYARLGVGEYWRFDATGGEFYGEPLVGETLAEGVYHRLPVHRQSGSLAWGRSPLLGLDLCWEPDRLRFFNPATGAYLPNLAESEARAEAAIAEAERLREQLRMLEEQPPQP